MLCRGCILSIWTGMQSGIPQAPEIPTDIKSAAVRLYHLQLNNIYIPSPNYAVMPKNKKAGSYDPALRIKST